MLVEARNQHAAIPKKVKNLRHILLNKILTLSQRVTHYYVTGDTYLIHIYITHRVQRKHVFNIYREIQMLEEMLHYMCNVICRDFAPGNSHEHMKTWNYKSVSKGLKTCVSFIFHVLYYFNEKC